MVRGAKRRHAVSGYWHTQQTLARSCRIRSYLNSAPNCKLTAPDAVTRALADDSWLPGPRELKNGRKPQLTGYL
jgi:hypothetical protein